MRDSPKRKLIGELLVEEGLVAPNQIEIALEEQKRHGGKLVQILISKGFLKIEDFEHFLARQPGIASIEIQNYAVQESLLNLIPAEFARTHEVFPLDKLGNILTVGMACPLDAKTIQQIETMTNLRVRALLCNAEDIRAMIAKYYKEEAEQDITSEVIPTLAKPKVISSEIRLEGVAELVRKIENLPSLPATVQRLQEAISNPEISLNEVVKIVSADPLVAAKLLRVVNSAAFGLAQRVESVAHAVTLLGLKETYMIALSAAVPDLFEKTPYFNYQQFWRDSVCSAAVCVALAEFSGIRRTALYFTAGLLHDIGKVVLAQVAPQRYGKVDHSLTDQAFLDEELRVLGISHTEAGYILASNWKFPSDLAAALRFHHSPELATDAEELVMTVAVGTSLTYALLHNFVSDWQVKNQHMLDKMKLTGDNYRAILERAKAALNINNLYK